MTRYEALAGEIAAMIESGVFKPGERLPSTRALADSHRASIATVVQAYSLLEDRGLIQARPRSGYFVNAHWKPAQELERIEPPARNAAMLDVSDLVFEVLAGIRGRRLVPLASAFPGPHLFPLDKLAVELGRSARRMDPWKTVEDLTPGSIELRRQVAKRYAAHGVAVGADEIVITSGALEALNLCLAAATRPGDVVAVESPTFYGALQAIERLGLRAVEVETDPRQGVDLASLDTAIQRHGVKACWLMPTLQNPLGATMPEAKKEELVRLLSRRGVALVEDDVYGELQMADAVQRPAKAFDRDGSVLHCGSFSKSLAPGYRLGWCAAGRFARAVERGKIATSLATSIPVQEGIAAYLRHGGYDRHLRALRQTFAANQVRMQRAIASHFPAGTRVTHPGGGYFSWVQVPSLDVMALYRTLLTHGIGIAPGPIFSARQRFGDCMRLNHGHAWDERMAAAVATVGRLAGGE